MAETLAFGDERFHVSDAEAETLRKLLAEGGPGLLPAVNTSKPKPQATLAGALAAVQAKLPEVVKAEQAKIPGKEGKTGYSYKYADLAAVSRAILPLLGEHGLSWVTKPTILEGRFVLVYKLLHPSGESEEGVYPLPDRGSPQDIGSAITYARRYTLCSVTGVAPDEDDDGAAATAAHRRAQDEPVVTPPMSDFERTTGRALLRPPTDLERATAGTKLTWAAFVQALGFLDCIKERDAWAQPSGGEDSPTWEELFAGRVVAEISKVATVESWRLLRDTLKDLGIDMPWQGKRISTWLMERASFIQQTQADNTTKLTEQVLAAGYNDLGGLAEKILIARDRGDISEAQFGELHTLHNERLEKLGRNQVATA